MTVPVEHAEEALKLEAARPIDLWEVRLVGSATIIRFVNGQAATWQGNQYDGIACGLTQEGDYSDEQVARPQLAVMNPANIFGPIADAGYLEMATAIRRRVLQAHLKADVNIFEQRVWVIGRVSAVSAQTLQVELRSPYDTPNFKVPNRFYIPPDFPFVSF